MADEEQQDATIHAPPAAAEASPAKEGDSE